MKLYLITNGEIENGQVFTKLSVALDAMKFQLPGEKLSLFFSEILTPLAVDENGITVTEGGDVRKVCRWLPVNFGE